MSSRKQRDSPDVVAFRCAQTIAARAWLSAPLLGEDLEFWDDVGTVFDALQSAGNHQVPDIDATIAAAITDQPTLVRLSDEIREASTTAQRAAYLLGLARGIVAGKGGPS